MPTPVKTEQRELGQRETVVLIHGIGAHHLLLTPLAFRLNRAGYLTHRYGYRSLLKTIPCHAIEFGKFLQSLESNTEISRFHIVAHSMGGIITRQMLIDHAFKKLGRVVMLGSPHHGSHAARNLGSVMPFIKTLNQLSDEEGSYVRKLSEPSNIELGIIAASYDHVVPRQSSHLKIASDHITMFSGHNGLLVRWRVAKQVIHYLQNGNFARKG